MEIELVEDFSSFVLSSGLDNCNFLHAVPRCPLRILSPLQDLAISLWSTSDFRRGYSKLADFCHPSWLFCHLRDYATTLKLTVFPCSLLLQAESWLTAVWLNWCNLISSTRTLLNFVYSAPSSTCRSFLPRPTDKSRGSTSAFNELAQFGMVRLKLYANMYLCSRALSALQILKVKKGLTTSMKSDGLGNRVCTQQAVRELNRYVFIMYV